MTVDRVKWTYSLKGPCVYCEVVVTRSFTVETATKEDADARAEQAMENHGHRKCRLY